VAGETGKIMWRTDLPGALVTGELCVWGEVVCAPASYKGVYLLHLASGACTPPLQTGQDGPEPKVCCAGGRVLVGNNTSDWDEVLVAYDTPEGRELWRATFARSYLWKAEAAHDTFVLLLSDPFGPGESNPPTHWEWVTLDAADGGVISRQAASKPLGDEIIPSALPPAVREWLVGLLKREGGVYMGRTRIERLADTWFVGNLPDRTAPSTVFAVQGATGKVMWQQSVPGLVAITLLDQRLIAAAGSTQKTGSRLLAFDAATGEPSWRTDLEAPP
jgi:outer membrane protein assembly factor BamB